MIKTYMNSHAHDFLEPGTMPSVEFITHVSNNPNFIYSAHKHSDRCEISFILKGRGFYTIDNVTYAATPGDIVIFDRDIVHLEQADPETEFEKWVCAVKGLHMAKRQENILSLPGTSPIISTGGKATLINNCYEIIFDACTNPSYHAYERCQHALCVVLTLIDEAVHADPGQTQSAKEDSFVRSVMAYIDLHYAEPITLDTLAQQFHISPDYLSHAVKKEIGVSPISYLISRRIGEGQRLLINTTLPINTIAAQVGYPNINHFSSSFKNRLGVSPIQFRILYNIINSEVTEP